MFVRCLVLVSGAGTLLQALIDASVAGDVPARVIAVGADRQAEGLARASRAGIPTFCHPLSKGQDRGEWDQELADIVASYQPDLVISAGFMKLVGKAFLDRFQGRFINTHPALLPSFPGAHAVRDALRAGVKVSGCTIFHVDEGVDSGDIIAQRAVAVMDGDDEASLHERIKQTERQLLIEVVRNWKVTDD